MNPIPDRRTISRLIRVAGITHAPLHRVDNHPNGIPVPDGMPDDETLTRVCHYGVYDGPPPLPPISVVDAPDYLAYLEWRCGWRRLTTEDIVENFIREHPQYRDSPDPIADMLNPLSYDE